MGKTLPFSFFSVRGFSVCLYACAYLALAGQSSCSGTGTKTFGNVPGSSNSSTSGGSTAVAQAKFDGFVSASAIDSTSGSIVYGASTGAASINVYCKIGVSSATAVLVRSISNIVSTGGLFVLNNLSSGNTFNCYGLAVNAAGVETPNLTPVSVSFQTSSVLQTAYRNVVTVKAFGDTANPAVAPTSRMVDISWQPFVSTVITSSTTYSVYRSAKSTYPTFPDSIPACLSTSTGTCKVTCRTGSIVSGNSNLRCIDTDIAVSPAQYWYYVSPLSNTTVASGPALSKPEEYPALPGALPADPLYPKVSSTITPTQDAYVTYVPIPPSEMALVHRESVNFEFCNLVNRASDLNTFTAGNGLGHLFKNRCAYNGLGARPQNSNSGGNSITIPGVAQGINTYDFGYNLFMDRVEAGCNWTSQSAGGMCGAGGTLGDCVGMVSQNVGATSYWISTMAKPSDTLGANGNVFLAFNGSVINGSSTSNVPFVGPNCYVKVNGSWTVVNDAAQTGTYAGLAQTMSSAPINNETTANAARTLPPLLVDQSSSYSLCNSQTLDSAGYLGAKKRLVRRREFVAASAWPIYQGEPNKLLQTQINQLRTSHSPAISVGPATANPATSPVSTDVGFARAGCYQPNYLGLNRKVFMNEAPTWTSGYWSTSGATSWQMLGGYNDLALTSRLPNLNNLVGSLAGYFMGLSGITYDSNDTWGRAGGVSGPGVIAVGSSWTKNCVSRFGVQDLLGNVPEWNAEEMTCDSTGCYGINSQFDDGASLASYGYNLDGNSGPLAKYPLWFIAADMGGSGTGSLFNINRGNASAVTAQPPLRSGAGTNSGYTGNSWFQSQFQVFSMGQTVNTVPSPGPLNYTGSIQSHVQHFHPALGLPAAAVGIGTLDYTDPSLSAQVMGVSSFHVMNGAPRVGLVSGSATSSAYAYYQNGAQNTFTVSGTYAPDSLTSHANRFTPIFESGNRITGAMFWPQPPKGFRCAFSPD